MYGIGVPLNMFVMSTVQSVGEFSLTNPRVQCCCCFSCTCSQDVLIADAGYALLQGFS